MAKIEEEKIGFFKKLKQKFFGKGTFLYDLAKEFSGLNMVEEYTEFFLSKKIIMDEFYKLAKEKNIINKIKYLLRFHKFKRSINSEFFSHSKIRKFLKNILFSIFYLTSDQY